MLTDIVLFAVGVFVGAVNSVAGGGMLVGFPTLIALGLPAITANVTGKLTVLPGQLTSAFGYRRFLRTLPKRYLLLILPCMLGGAAGAVLLRRTPGAQFEHLAPVLVLAAVILFAFEPLLHRYIEKGRHRKAILPFGIILLLVLITATYGGYFGAGFGFLILAFLGFSNLSSIHHMNLLKNLIGALSAAIAIIVLVPTSLINWHFGIVMGIGNGAGGYLGSRLATKLPAGIIRMFIICFGILTAIYLFRRT
jgi:uncharacterized membrane protein YfcA